MRWRPVVRILVRPDPMVRVLGDLFVAGATPTGGYLRVLGRGVGWWTPAARLSFSEEHGLVRRIWIGRWRFGWLSNEPYFRLTPVSTGW